MQPLLQLSRFIDAFTQRIGTMAYWLAPIMVLVGVWNVAGRFIGQAIDQNLTSNTFIEAQWYLFSLIFLLGAPYALLHNEHVRVDVVYARLNQRQRAIVNVLGTLLFLLPFTGLLIYFSWGPISNSWVSLEESSDPGGLPRYPLRTMIIVSAMLLVIQGISEIIKNVAFLIGKHPPEAKQADIDTEAPADDQPAGSIASPTGAPATAAEQHTTPDVVRDEHDIVTERQQKQPHKEDQG